MASHHEPFASLGPIDWEDVPQDTLPEYLDDIFSEAQTVIDSIPSAHPFNNDPAAPASPGRARAKTDPAVLDTTTATTSSTNTLTSKARPRTPASAAQAQKLQKEWKEIKVNPRENPHDVKVYKLGAKDGRGAWFARSSLHEGLSFEHWKDGLQREFVETMKVQGQPGSGSIRGIGADKRVENHDLHHAGHVQVFQLSAQFPGPTSPRDFITLLLTSETPQPDQSSSSQPLRQFMIVSKPCLHTECPPRSGIIRGSYESVEFIREVPISSEGVKRSLSSTDLNASKDANPRGSTSSDKGHDSGVATTIEWLMVTRSDPGGSVPRFMIEKGTPPGIVNDCGKFLNWLKSKPTDDPATVESAPTDGVKQAPTEATSDKKTVKIEVPFTPASDSQPTVVQQGAGDDAYWSNGLFGMITGAFEAASSVVTGGLRRQFTAGRAEYPESPTSSQNLDDSEEEEASPSETSSVRSFTSALEKSMTGDKDQESLHGSQSDDKSQGGVPQIKELKKLQERRRRLDEKAAKMAERLESRRAGDKERDAAALAKAREKHEKEIAKHEAKYKRELRKLEEKREAEERKAEERRKKALDREEKSNLALELEKARNERDIAVKQMELLKAQVGELQAQNTMLVARLGKQSGSDKADSGSSSSKEFIRGVDRTASLANV